MRRRKLLFRISAVVAGLVLAAWAWAAYLVRDPEPYFRARRGPVAAVEVQGLRRDGDAWREDVRIVSTTGLSVEMAIRRPADSATVVRRPLFILLGGHETGREAVELVREARGTVVAALSFPYAGSTRLKGWKVVPAAPGIRRALLDTPPAVMLALDHLIEQPYVDPARVELVGVSLGAPFACIAGALDTRFARVWSIHGAGDLLAVLDYSLRNRIAFGPLRAVVARSVYVMACGPRLTPERWVGRIAPRAFVMVNAEDDERLPRACIDRLYAAAREPREIVWRPGLHVQPNRKDIVQGLLDVVLDRLR